MKWGKEEEEDGEGERGRNGGGALGGRERRVGRRGRNITINKTS